LRELNNWHVLLLFLCRYMLDTWLVFNLKCRCYIRIEIEKKNWYLLCICADFVVVIIL
jgi:hypothetical protein